MTPPTASDQVWARRWQRLSSVSMQAFHRYANWLVSITWKRFIVLSILLMIVAAILPSLPPFSWRVTETIEDTPTPQSRGPPPKPPPPIPRSAGPARARAGDQDRTSLPAAPARPKAWTSRSTSAASASRPRQGQHRPRRALRLRLGGVRGGVDRR
jgi:hypothetical protein